MKLLNFKASNLFSLGDAELNLDKRGLLLITGHSNDEGGANGSGKSSLSSKGIVWTLFGNTAGGDRADAVINRFADENTTCSGTLDVESNNGSRYSVIRSRRPNRLTVIDLATGADISCKTEKDTQAMVDALLGRTRETFLQTDFFGQGKAANFLDLTPKAQAELLETILPFEALTKLADDAKCFLTKLKVVQSSIEKHVAEHNGKMLEAQRQERELSTSIDQWEAKHESTIVSLTAEIARQESADPLTAKIEELKTLVASLPNRRETKEELLVCQEAMNTLGTSKASYTDALNQWRIIASTKIVEPKNNVCPTCNEPMSSEKFDELLGAHIHHSMEISHGKINVEKYRTVLAQIETSIQDITIRFNAANENIRKHDQIDLEIAKLEVTRNNDNLAILRQRLADVQLAINPYESLYTNNASTLKLVTSSLGHHKARLVEIENDNKALEFWYMAFNKELKNEFLNQVCPFLETKANIHLEGMGNGQIKVKISTTKLLQSTAQRSEFNIGVTSLTGASSYDGLSGGEKQIVNFATGLALADLAEVQVEGPSYFMVLDEPFMALDARNSEHLVDYLNNYLKSKKETILLVSNEESLKVLIPNRIQVVKENGVSRLEDV